MYGFYSAFCLLVDDNWIDHDVSAHPAMLQARSLAAGAKVWRQRQAKHGSVNTLFIA